ncbi:hypothetical protein N0V88_007627 [Collariella sp. IMI 366227]|nr:hypothetical protein N0V88_007627 [Collariella sp. IMI 366227]
MSAQTPYLPSTAPSAVSRPLPDIPISAALLALFAVSCSAHFLLFQWNKYHGHKFIFSLLFAGFSLTRIAALALRIKWAQNPSTPTSRWRRPGVLVFTSVILTLGAGFRAGVNLKGVPAGQQRWFLGRAPFYCFNFAIELLVVFPYLFLRFDQRFWVSNGSSKPGDYSRVGPEGEELEATREGSGESATGVSVEKEGVDDQGRRQGDSNV